MSPPAAAAMRVQPGCSALRAAAAEGRGASGRPDPALAARLGLVRDAQGAAAVEFALVLPLLLLLLAGLTDVSRAILTSLRLKAAAQAGVDYAASRGWSPTAIASAAAQATPLAVSVTPTLASACDSPTGLEPPTAP